jgi:hypothetical protein
MEAMTQVIAGTMVGAMAHSHLDILIAEINKHRRRFDESRRDLAETIAMTRNLLMNREC